MLIKTQPSTLFKLVNEFMINVKVIFKSIIGLDDTCQGDPKASIKHLWVKTFEHWWASVELVLHQGRSPSLQSVYSLGEIQKVVKKLPGLGLSMLRLLSSKAQGRKDI